MVYKYFINFLIKIKIFKKIWYNIDKQKNILLNRHKFSISIVIFYISTILERSVYVFKRNIRKKHAHMCKKIKEIHGMHPEHILDKLNINSCDKIIAQNILEKMEISCEPIDFSPLERDLFLDENDSILGIAFSEGDELNILYSNQLRDKEKNYVLAHELAHCCLHLPVSADFHVEMKIKDDIYSNSSSSYFSIFRNKREVVLKEKEADKFSANLLLPTNLFIQTILSKSFPTIKTISDSFEVPEHLILEKIKLINQRKIGW